MVLGTLLLWFAVTREGAGSTVRTGSSLSNSSLSYSFSASVVCLASDSFKFLRAVGTLGLWLAEAYVGPLL